MQPNQQPHHRRLEPLARQYLAYWHALQAEGAAQGATLRTSNRSKLPAVDLGAGQGSVQAWFSPNTVRSTKPSKNPATPVDLQEVFDLMASAEKGVLFLAFIPGRPSIVTELRRIYEEKVHQGQRLFVRGAATDPGAPDEFKVEFFHRTMRSDASVTSVAGINDPFSYWQRELYKLGHAVIHDKIVVIDPFTDNCTVITGSHNLGFKASYANDENMLIIRGKSGDRRGLHCPRAGRLRSFSLALSAAEGQFKRSPRYGLAGSRRDRWLARQVL